MPELTNKSSKCSYRLCTGRASCISVQAACATPLSFDPIPTVFQDQQPGWVVQKAFGDTFDVVHSIDTGHAEQFQVISRY